MIVFFIIILIYFLGIGVSSAIVEEYDPDVSMAVASVLCWPFALIIFIGYKIGNIIVNKLWGNK